jgi:hypothetical protein
MTVGVRQPGVALKFAAISTSVLLVTGLVCYRAGCFDGFPQASTPPVVSRHKLHSVVLTGSGREIASVHSADSASDSSSAPSVTSKNDPAGDYSPPTDPDAPFDWVKYYKARGYGSEGSGARPPVYFGGTKYSPVFVVPQMQWAMPPSSFPESRPGLGLPYPPNQYQSSSSAR